MVRVVIVHWICKTRTGVYCLHGYQIYIGVTMSGDIDSGIARVFEENWTSCDGVNEHANGQQTSN